MEIKGLIETSFLDWPGQVSAVVFLGGCNFRCPYCHNHELVLKHTEMEGQPIDFALEKMAPEVDWLDGLVVSGGEPTIHNWLPDMCRKIQAAGFKVRLDSNGTRPEMLAGLIGDGLIDGIAMDIKAPLCKPELHQRLSGVKADLDKIAQSIDLIINSGLEHLFRTTYVPGLLTEDDLVLMADQIRGAQKWILNTFRPLTCLDPEFEKITPLEKEEAARLQEKVDQLMAERRTAVATA